VLLILFHGRLDDLDKVCAALGCTVADLLEPEPVEMAVPDKQGIARAVGDQGASGGASPPKATAAGLCRGCILAVTEFDADWYFAPDALSSLP
jgi:hypothetical protein